MLVGRSRVNEGARTPEAQARLDGIHPCVKRGARFYAQGVVDKLTRCSQ
jgi:hypothetical protein